jgi:hypothetical protein
MRHARPQNRKVTRRDRVIFWLTVAVIYFAGAFGIFPLIGVHMSTVHKLLSGVSMLAGWCLARWLGHRFFAEQQR